MKRFILTLITLLILITGLHGQWEILNQGATGSLKAMDFVNENIGWLINDEGLLFKTVSGGQTWYPLPPDANWYLGIIDFISDSIGWTVAGHRIIDKRAILKTIDGGQSWQIQMETNNWLASLFAVNQDVVYAVENYNKIIKTSDGGAVWTDISPNNENRDFCSIWFFCSDTGFVAGTFHKTPGDYSDDRALILKTEDGGKAWTEKISSELQSIDDLQFINDSTGFFLCGDNPGHLYKTEDAFGSWPTSPIIDSTWVYSYHALNRDTINALAAEDGVGYWAYGCILKKSTNGGLTWENKFFSNWNVDKIYFRDPQVGFLFGGAPYGGTIFRSIDSGEHWEHRLLSYPFHDVHFIDRDTGFACGGLSATHFSSGNILITHNGGKNWEAILSAGGVVGKCQFVNDQVGLAFGRFYRSPDFMLKTVDGGKSWISKDAFGESGIIICSDFFFVNEKTGWAVGSYGEGDSHGAGIVKTVDQGDNWELVWKYPDQNEIYPALHSIQFIDSITGWAVGANGLIVKSTNGIQWELHSKITDLPLTKVFFIDEHNGFIAGGYLNDEDNQAILFKTTNGGETWGKIPDFPYLINDIYFHDALHGWAIGADQSDKRVILETQDGGDHWSVQGDSLIGSLNALSYRDGYLWAVGDYGLVLRTLVDSTAAIVERSNSAGRLTCELSQNYPNPFNPTTTIRYQLAALSQVELSVYNLLGQKVATLVSAKQPAGTYKAEWDGAEFSSGVYFCRMEARDPLTSSPNKSGQAGQSFVKVIKLALVK